MVSPIAFPNTVMNLMTKLTPLLFASFFLPAILGAESALSRNRLEGDCSFETTAGLIFTRDVAGAPRAEVDTTTAAIGDQSLKLTFAGGESTQGEPVRFQQGEQVFSFYAKADRPTKVQVRFVKTDWKHSFPSGWLEIGTEWKRYSTPQTFRDGFYSIHLVMEDAGTLWVDALQLEEGRTVSPFEVSSPVNLGIEIASDANRVFLRKEPVEVTVAIQRTPDVQPGKELKIEVRDGAGNSVVRETTTELKWNENGVVRKKLTLQPDRLGLYEVKVVYPDGKKTLEQRATFAVVQPPVEIKPGMMPFSGVNPPSSAGIRKIGGRWVGMAAQWSIIEPERGKFEWKGYDHFFRAVQPGEQVILSIGRNPSWCWDPKEAEHAKELGIPSPGPWGLLIAKDRMDDWRRFIQELVKRYGKQVAIWEIGAEDDLHWGRHPYYTKLVHLGLASKSEVYDRQADAIIAASEEIRKLLPDAVVGAIRPSGVDSVEVNPMYQYSSGVLEKAGKAITVFPIDPYGSSRYLGPGQHGIKEPEAYLPDSYEAARKMLNRHSPGTALYVSEFGYSVAASEPPNGPSMKMISEYVARAFLLNRATPGLLLSRWYTGFAGGVPGVFHYNMWHGRDPSLAVPAFSAVAAVVENAVESRRIDLGKQAWGVAFRKEDHGRGAIWQTKETSLYRFPNSDGITFSDLMGNPITPTRTANEVELTVGTSPIYLNASGKEGMETITRFFRSGHSTSAPLEVAVTTPAVNSAILHFTNLSTREIAAEMSTDHPDRSAPSSHSVAIAKGETKQVTVPLLQGRENLTITCEFDGTYEPLTKSFPLKFYPCQWVGEEWALDGRMDKWKTAAVATLDNEEHLRPVDWNPWRGKDDLRVEIYLGWNQRYLYLTAKVLDDVHTPAPSTSEVFKGDTLEVGIDPLNELTATAGKLSAGSYDFNVALDPKNQALFTQWAGPKANLLQEGDYTVVRNDETATTVYEIRIPWQRLDIKPEVGRVLGLNAAVFDEDQGQRARIWMQWGPGLTQGKDSSLFPRIYLAPQSHESR